MTPEEFVARDKSPNGDGHARAATGALCCIRGTACDGFRCAFGLCQPAELPVHQGCSDSMGRDASAQWKPGEFVTIARRHGDEWYLGSLTNWTARDLRVPLSFLGNGKIQGRNLRRCCRCCAESEACVHSPAECAGQRHTHVAFSQRGWLRHPVCAGRLAGRDHSALRLVMVTRYGLSFGSLLFICEQSYRDFGHGDCYARLGMAPQVE